MLQEVIDGFRITSGTTDLRLINGGSRCPGPSGFEPPGYQVNGRISLQECAAAAKDVKGILGFRRAAAAPELAPHVGSGCVRLLLGNVSGGLS